MLSSRASTWNLSALDSSDVTHIESASSHATLHDADAHHARLRTARTFMFRRGCNTMTMQNNHAYTSRCVRVILAQGHAHLLCIVPSLKDDPRRKSNNTMTVLRIKPSTWPNLRSTQAICAGSNNATQDEDDPHPYEA